MALLDGKKILVTGLLTEASLAYGVARLALAEGAEIIVTGAGPGLKHTERNTRKLAGEGGEITVLEFDVTDPAHPARVAGELAERWDRVDGALHAIGFAPAVCLGGHFMEAQWDDVSVAMHTSAYSLQGPHRRGAAPLMGDGGSIVGLDFDATVAWPVYDWMGVAKAALESTARYLARDLGAAGHPGQPRRRRPAEDGRRTSIPGFERVRARRGSTRRRSAGT